MNKARCDYYSSFVEDNGNDQGKLFRASKKLLKQSTEIPFPLYADDGDLANDLGKYFMTKIINIRSDLSGINDSTTDADQHSMPEKMPEHQFPIF